MPSSQSRGAVVCFSYLCVSARHCCVHRIAHRGSPALRVGRRAHLHVGPGRQEGPRRGGRDHLLIDGLIDCINQYAGTAGAGVVGAETEAAAAAEGLSYWQSRR